ncbi:unnamed protein product [Arabidopsis halleri]
MVCSFIFVVSLYASGDFFSSVGVVSLFWALDSGDICVFFRLKL